MSKVYGIIGFPLSHSFSNQFFTAKFRTENLADCIHEVYPLTDINQLKKLVQEKKHLLGLNVTIPFKESVLPFLDELDETATAVGAVNTIKIVQSKTKNKPLLVGYNTDVFGFANSLKPFLKNNHQRALILGTGGAAKAVAYVLKNLGIDYYFVSRNPAKANIQSSATVFAYADLNENHIKSCQLIVNCSPSGMYPKVEEFPELPYTCIGSEHLLFDLIYNPIETIFLKKGKMQGALTQNGLTMLYLQAEESWRIWNS